MAEKSLKAKDLRGLPEADMKEKLSKLRQTQWQNRLKSRDGSLKQMHVLRRTRREIARIHTILQELRRETPPKPSR